MDNMTIMNFVLGIAFVCVGIMLTHLSYTRKNTAPPEITRCFGHFATIVGSFFIGMVFAVHFLK